MTSISKELQGAIRAKTKIKHYVPPSVIFTFSTGDWVISGGFIQPVTDTAQVSTKTVEIINANLQKAESDVPMDLAQHCLVHVYCYYTFFAGGTSFAGNIGKKIFQYKMLPLKTDQKKIGHVLKHTINEKSLFF